MLLITWVCIAAWLLQGNLGGYPHMKGYVVPRKVVQPARAAGFWIGSASLCREGPECLSGWCRPEVPMQGVGPAQCPDMRRAELDMRRAELDMRRAE